MAARRRSPRAPDLLEGSGYRTTSSTAPLRARSGWKNVSEARERRPRQYVDLEPAPASAALLEERAGRRRRHVDEEHDAVYLITFHAAKGLEFPVFFLTGKAGGRRSPLPLVRRSRPDGGGAGGLASTWAVARARERLYLVYAFRRAPSSAARSAERSRPHASSPTSPRTRSRQRADRLRGHSGDALRPATSSQPVRRRRSSTSRVRYVDREEATATAIHDVQFVLGDRVRHQKFGEGIVVSSVLAHGDEEVKVAFQGIGVKKLGPLLRLPLGRQLVVPASAVLQAGTRQIAFIDHGQGYLEPRVIEVGPRVDDRVAVLQGLRLGERVVSSANFLVDSEAQLQAAMGSFAPPPPGTGAAAAMNAPAQQIGIDLSTEPEPPHKGANTVRIKLTGADGKPVTGAEVRATFFMAAMPAMGMAAMRDVATLADKGTGLYEGPLHLQTGGTWQVTVTVQRGGQTIATKQLSVSATGGM